MKKLVPLDLLSILSHLNVIGLQALSVVPAPSLCNWIPSFRPVELVVPDVLVPMEKKNVTLQCNKAVIVSCIAAMEHHIPKPAPMISDGL